jgi:DNA-binding GntR family transcriptional regulator
MVTNPPIKLKKIRPAVHRGEKAYQIIKDAVIHRQFSPGVWVKQDEVSQALGMSRTPLRQALARLQSEGLIEARPRKGFRAVKFTSKELDNLFEVREVLETNFFIRSAKLIPRKELVETLNTLREYENKMKKSESKPKLWEKQLRGYLKVDRAFHDRLIEACDNEQWLYFYLNLRDKIDLIGYQVTTHFPGLYSQSFEEHNRIISALLSGQYQEARQAMKEHIRSVKDSIVTIEEETSGD